MATKFSEFSDGGDLQPTDEVVGLRSGANTKFNAPLPLSGGTLSGNLNLGNFSQFNFTNNTNDLNNCLQYLLYDYTGGGLYALSVYSIESGSPKQLFTIFQDDPSIPGQVKYTWPFPKVSRSITMNDQGQWVGPQPIKTVSYNPASGSVTLNFSSGNFFTPSATLSQATTFNAPTNLLPGYYTIMIQQNASTSYAVTLNAAFIPLCPAFSMTPTLSAWAALNITCDGTNVFYTWSQA